MEVLRRIDKGYSLIAKARKRADKLLDIKAIQELEQEINIKNEEEALIRSKIDEVKTSLLQYEKFLADAEKEMENLLKSIYEGNLMNDGELEEMKNREQQLLQEREETEKKMFQDFSLIDNYTKELYAHKHKANILERKLSKQKINQHEKLVYLEDKIKVMEKKIRKLRKTVDDKLLDMYDRRKSETEMVFSKIEVGKCKLCGTQISEDLMKRIMAEEDIIECIVCGRILYIDENDD